LSGASFAKEPRLYLALKALARRPESVSEDGARIGGDDIKEIRRVMEKIERALGEPILDFDSFGRGRDS
jgi:hypothetical protein